MFLFLSQIFPNPMDQKNKKRYSPTPWTQKGGKKQQVNDCCSNWGKMLVLSLVQITLKCIETTKASRKTQADPMTTSTAGPCLLRTKPVHFQFVVFLGPSLIFECVIFDNWNIELSVEGSLSRGGHLTWFNFLYLAIFRLLTLRFWFSLQIYVERKKIIMSVVASKTSSEATSVIRHAVPVPLYHNIVYLVCCFHQRLWHNFGHLICSLWKYC